MPLAVTVTKAGAKDVAGRMARQVGVRRVKPFVDGRRPAEAAGRHGNDPDVAAGDGLVAVGTRRR